LPELVPSQVAWQRESHSGDGGQAAS
jgi:hypothetical protein